MFFTTRLHRTLSEQRICFTPNTKTDICNNAFAPYIQTTLQSKLFGRTADKDAVPCSTVHFGLGIPNAVKADIETSTPVVGNDEEYAILLGEETWVYAKTEKGLLFGLATLLHLADHNELQAALLYDYPVCPIRGYRVYLPGSANVGLFKQMLDLLVYYKFNAIILEIGGAMEYKRHPEINEHWLVACADAMQYSGRTSEIQNQYPWPKNSIHCENGDGGVLSQAKCRDIADYCRACGLEIIPECPTYSHSDYIVQAHPEIRERENDGYPDTYCPLNPDTYPLVFDLLDEVIEVFHPKRINIGHDELYSVGICEKCRQFSPVDLYINDIIKLRDHLAEHGVETMMWGEKLVKAVGKNGKHYGGWYNPKQYSDGSWFQIPDMYQCAERMPEGVTFLHWYWVFDYKLDRVYHDHHYPVVFGNFNALECEHFRERIAWGTKGGFVSNWGSNEEEYMQRNLQNISLIGTAYAFWCPDFDETRVEFFIQKALEEDYRRHYHGKKNLIRVVHSTDLHIPFNFFYCGIFIVDEKYLLGNYRITYSDGTSVLLPVKYGTNITCCRHENGLLEQGLQEVSGSTLPKKVGDLWYYECNYENPHPEKTIASFAYEPLPGKEDARVVTRSVEFYTDASPFDVDEASANATEKAVIYE